MISIIAKFILVIFISFMTLNSLKAEESDLIEYHLFNNGWNIYIDTTIDFRCVLHKDTTNGSDFRLGTYVEGDQSIIYVSLFNSKWQSIRDNSDYNISMTFDYDQPYVADGIGVNTVDWFAPGFMVNATNENLIQDFMASNYITFYVDDKLIEQISLEGSTIATEKLAECQDFVTEAINESLDDNQDPFQNSTRRKSLSDPFM